MATSKMQTGLRLEESVYWKLKALSEKECRSINNLVEYIVQQYLEDYEARNGAITPASPKP